MLLIGLLSSDLLTLETPTGQTSNLSTLFSHKNDLLAGFSSLGECDWYSEVVTLQAYCCCRWWPNMFMTIPCVCSKVLNKELFLLSVSMKVHRKIIWLPTRISPVLCFDLQQVLPLGVQDCRLCYFELTWRSLCLSWVHHSCSCQCDILQGVSCTPGMPA